jgi:hypothetical protein
MNCPYCNVPYTVGLLGSLFHSCKQWDLNAEQKRWQSTATITIGDEKMTIQEASEMVAWVKREMKK